MNNTAGISGTQLKNYIQQIESLEEKKYEFSQDIKEIMNEAKSNGFDVKTIRSIIRIRKIDKNDLQEQEELLSIYLNAINNN